MKKGQIFSFDIVIALVILVIGIAIIFYVSPAKTKSLYDTERISEDVISVLQATKITDLCLHPGNNVAHTSYGCSCPNYARLQTLVCDERLLNNNSDLISLMTELIETRRVPQSDITAMIKEMFVTKNVIDERRYGFAIIYTVPNPDPLLGQDTYELYNTERQS